MKYAVIFDMDGVLIDSTKYIWKSFNILLKKEGIYFSKKDIKKYLGSSLRDQLKSWKKEYGMRDYDMEKFSRKSGEIQLGLMGKKLYINKALNKLLIDLRNNGVRCAVATSSLRWRAEKILSILKIKNYFDIVVTSEDVQNHKPNPDIFLEAAKRLHEDPKYCVVIEDAASGIEAAKRAHMKSIGYLTQYHTKAELSKADSIIKNFSELSYQKIKKLFAISCR